MPYDDWGTLTWYDVDEERNKIRKILILTHDMKHILENIWDHGVFYINFHTDYGKPLCEIAIKRAKQLSPPQFINYHTLRVSEP